MNIPMELGLSFSRSVDRSPVMCSGIDASDPIDFPQRRRFDILLPFLDREDGLQRRPSVRIDPVEEGVSRWP